MVPRHWRDTGEAKTEGSPDGRARPQQLEENRLGSVGCTPPWRIGNDHRELFLGRAETSKRPIAGSRSDLPSPAQQHWQGQQEQGHAGGFGDRGAVDDDVVEAGNVGNTGGAAYLPQCECVDAEGDRGHSLEGGNIEVDERVVPVAQLDPSPAGALEMSPATCGTTIKSGRLLSTVAGEVKFRRVRRE